METNKKIQQYSIWAGISLILYVIGFFIIPRIMIVFAFLWDTQSVLIGVVFMAMLYLVYLFFCDKVMKYSQKINENSNIQQQGFRWYNTVSWMWILFIIGIMVPILQSVIYDLWNEIIPTFVVLISNILANIAFIGIWVNFFQYTRKTLKIYKNIKQQYAGNLSYIDKIWFILSIIVMIYQVFVIIYFVWYFLLPFLLPAKYAIIWWILRQYLVMFIGWFWILSFIPIYVYGRFSRIYYELEKKLQ